MLLPSAVFAAESTGSLSTGGSPVSGIIISAPIPSVPSGTYTSSQLLSINHEGANYVCYTNSDINPSCNWGSLSCSSGVKYSNEVIQVSSNTNFRAVSCYPDDKESSVAVFSYMINQISSVSSSGSSGGSSGGGGGSYYSCKRPIFSDISPEKNSKVDNLDNISFVVENSEESKISLKINGEDVNFDYNDGVVTYNVDNNLSGKVIINISADSSSSNNCSRSYTYILTIGTEINNDELNNNDSDNAIDGVHNEGLNNFSDSSSYKPCFDDTKGHWAEEYICYFKANKIVNGKTDKIFSPDLPITRAEVTKVILVAFEVELEKLKTTSFVDVKIGDWFFQYVENAKSLGYVNGKNKYIFDPHNNITRAETLKIALEVAGIKKVSGDNSFVDVKPNHWFNDYVTTALSIGIINDDKEIFLPNEKISRAEVVKMVYDILMYKKTIETGDNSN